VNTSSCAALAQANANTNPNQYACGSNYNNSIASNYSVTCACVPGISGINCGDSRLSLGAIAAISGGIIAAIVLAALVALGLAGGGAMAMTNAMTASHEGGLFNNPLYEGKQQEGQNPLHEDM